MKTVVSCLTFIYFLQYVLPFVNGLSAIAATELLYTCDPNKDCLTYGVGAKVPDPKDCHNFYLCITSNNASSPSDVSLKCPDGEAYDYISGTCAAETVACINQCFNHCQGYCGEYVDDKSLIADPYNCSIYYVCLQGAPVEVSCTSDFPYFNGNNCTDNILQCCNICKPYCEEEYTETADPTNCHNFYLCTEIGFASEDNKYSCGLGEYFNPAIGKCDIIDPLDDCEPLCPTVYSSTTPIEVSTEVPTTVPTEVSTTIPTEVPTTVSMEDPTTVPNGAPART